LVAAAANAAPSSTSMVPPTMTNVDEPTESVAPAAPWATAGAWETRSGIGWQIPGDVESFRPVAAVR